jgi:organic hydroperoxide reductase OsmC/OhrA
MAEHRAFLEWENTGGEFTKGQFPRRHIWRFDGGLEVPASSAPGVVPAPYSDPAAIDPEEAFVASLASCHMLTFLFLASRQGFEVSRYEDEAVGEMARGENGVPWVSSVTLAPRVEYSGENRPGPEDETSLHEKAHEQCFIANSVKTAITVAPRRAAD